MINQPASKKTVVCNVCGSVKFSPLAKRSDGMNVIQCEDCTMAVVEFIPEDLSIFYQDDYYSSAKASNDVGYLDYDTTSEHGVLWASALVELVFSSGKVLDIGCANGYLLNSLSPQFQKYGIEANEKAAEYATSLGINVLSNDILDPKLSENYPEYFDIITAVAVFEHIADFKGAIKAALALLKPNGALFFEVPLISETNSNATWLSTSLEHIYYPTQKGLRRLLEIELGVTLIGGELFIQDYASTFVGIVLKDNSSLESFSYIYERVLHSKLDDLSIEERKAQMLLKVIHAATSTTENIATIHELFPKNQKTPFLNRCLSLWKQDAIRLASLRSNLVDSDLAKVWHSNNAERWQAQYVESSGHWESQAAQFNIQRKDYLAAQKLAARRLDIANAERDELIRELHNSETKRQEIATELHFLYRSKSWLLTEPFRHVLRIGILGRKKTVQRITAISKLVNYKRLANGFGLLRKGEYSALNTAIQHVSKETFKKARFESKPERLPDNPLLVNQPIVTVVIPCFNYGKFVVAAIDSVLAQTIKNVEILVIDGGSTDEHTIEVLKGLGKSKAKVTMREGRHLVGDNRNFGIDLAQGRYICCLDADDTLDPTYLEKAIFHLETYGYDVVSTAINFIGAKSGTIDILEFPNFDDMIQANHVLTCAVFRRSLWASVGGYFDVGIGQHHVAEDWDFWLRLAAKGARIRNLSSEYLFNYRVHLGGSLSTATGTKDLADQRAEILKRNATLITPIAINHSKANQARCLLADPTKTGLVPREQSHIRPVQQTILLAMPFTLIGGAERLLSGLCDYLATAGWRVLVATTLPQDKNFGSSIDWFKKSSAEVFSLPTFLAEHERGDFLQYLVATRQPHCLLIAGSRLTYEQLPKLKSISPNLAVVDLLFNCVGHIESHLEFKPYISFALAENAEVLDWFNRVAGWHPEKVQAVSSGIDLKLLSPKPRSKTLVARHAILDDELVIGFSGRLSIEKAPEIFLQIALLCQSIPRLRFFITGAGPMADEIQKQAAALPTWARLEFLGLVDDVYEYFTLYDILLLPSRVDGRPLVVMEALACGIPVIASNVGGLPDLLTNGQNGYLVEAGQAQSFADTVKAVAADRQLLAELKLNARTFALKHLDAKHAYRAFEIALKQVI
jgi:O-antigen biosynthesis protein